MPVIISASVVGGLIVVVILGACVYMAVKQLGSQPAALSNLSPPTKPMSRAPVYGVRRPSDYTPRFHNWV